MEGMNLPVHVGLIMDGNRRWAKAHKKLSSFGHKAGVDTMMKLAEYAQARGIKYFTVYALSSENLQRPKDEINYLYLLIRNYFKSNVKKLYARGAAVRVIGDMSALPEDIAALLKKGEENSPKGAQFTFTFAINYGGRPEIINAVNRAVERGEKVDASSFEKLLYTDGLPDPDLIIRTGGELRLSNFLLYQSAYAELYFSEILFPDFTEKDFEDALENFSRRVRHFGNI